VSVTVRDLTTEFRALLSKNLGPALNDPKRRVPPAYGVEAHLDGAVIHVRLVFKTNEPYCCGEPGCHLPTGARFEAYLRESLGLRDEPPLQYAVAVVVEAGARFQLLDFSPSEPQEYRWDCPVCAGQTRSGAT
jgi:hypothetical protein